MRRRTPTLDDLPPESTRSALAEQNTPALHREARRFASSRVRFVRALGESIPTNYATELVVDAIADTWLGMVKWDPDRCSLLVHVRGVIFDRTSKHLRRGRRFSHVAIEAAAADPSDYETIERALSPSMAAEGTPLLFAAIVRQVVDELAAQVSDHADARSILDCWRDGAIEREEIIARTGLSEPAYKVARQRLMSAAARLPAALRDATRGLLRSVS